MDKFHFEELEIVMNHAKVNGKPINIDDYGFSREFAFHIDGADYEVRWFHNQSTLTSGFLSVMFHHVKVANTWPNRSRMNLQFYDASNHVVAVLPIDHKGNES